MSTEIKLSAKDKSKYLTAWNSKHRTIVYDEDAMTKDEITLFKDDPQFIIKLIELKEKEQDILDYISNKVKNYRTK